MATREEVLNVMKIKGPVIPVHIAKAFETSILFASAMLSDLVSAKLAKVSKVKIGGSPLYYIPEQRSRLQEFSKHLPSKEKEAYDLLRQEKVLNDSKQHPAIKVALRNINDFAWPLQVTIAGQKELFWKWYLLSNEEASAIIKKAMGLGEKKPEPEKPKTESKPTEKREEAFGKEEKQALKETRTPEKKEEKEGAEFKPKPPRLEKPKAKTGIDFSWQILQFFTQNNVKVLNKEVIRKNETDFIVELRSAVGGLRYYCKTKAKQKISDSDLSSAYVQGQIRKLPVLFLTDGEPTKKAKEMLSKEFENMVFKKI
ncbi:hypothetical protein JW707_03855 [Candidatus Woesearchaeota archaeon]|nr:hypothetical protein [Candidatus Woesearchaeota archaeon]